MASIEERVRTIVVKQLDDKTVNADDLKNEASFVNDLGADSLDSVELIMALEEEFDIVIPDEEAENITTIQQAIDFIESKKASVN